MPTAALNSDNALPIEQGRIARRILVGVAVSVATGAMVWSLPIKMAAMTTADRIAFAVRADLPIAVWLIFMIARVATIRFYSSADIRGSAYNAPSPRLAVDVAVLQNSTEQAIVAFIAHMALATLLDGRGLLVIPTLVGLFCFGRIAFWSGYARGAAARAFGMAMTFYPTVAAILLGLALSLRGLLDGSWH